MSQQNIALELIFLLMIFTGNLNVLPIANSLTLDMVRRDSFDFDLFPKNLSDFQKNQIFIQLSHSRAGRLSSQLPISVNDGGSINNGTIQPRLKQFMSSLFAVSLGIGSIPYNTYLLVDTGSSYLWVQCQGCKNGQHDCFKIKNGPFNQTVSSSYHKLRFDDDLCLPREKVAGSDDCMFEKFYGTGHALGERALESLHFHSSKRGHLTIRNMVLGCATSVTDWTLGLKNDGPKNLISGIFGLAIEHIKYNNSFLELTESFTKMKFSYCLPSWTASKSKSIPLSFGDDVPHLPPSAQSTPMDNTKYYLNIIDISVGGKRLNLNPSIFKRRGDTQGGFIIDSGCGVTFLVRSAYRKVRDALGAILASKGKHPEPPPRGYRNVFCYKWPLKINNPPSVTYHFENNADIEVSFVDLFYREKYPEIRKYFACLSFDYVNEGETSILGSGHQADYRFVYNLNQKTLHWHREKC